MTRRLKSVIDLRELPDVVFGARDIMWWGTLAFIVIEGFTLVLCAAAYVYLTQNYVTWPPEHTPLPSLGAPTVQVLVMLASLPVVRWTSKAAHRFELGQVRIGLTVVTLFGLAFLGIRLVELLVSLNVRWDTNAYASAQWMLLCMHGTLLAVELIEVGGMMLVFWLAPVEEKHFSDVADMGFYWFFMVLAWMPLYLLCFWVPRWLQ
jgi:cytochrome c oxidase subunit 3